MTPLVSVIIPTYNRRAMVREAIESVRAQSYKGFELIVVDDGSTDGTRADLATRESGLRLFFQSRQGVSAARNLGARMSRGRYVAFLDSDDLWLPKKLEIQTAFMERNADIQICQTEEIWLRNGVRVNPRAKHRKPSGDIFRRSLDLCLVSPSAVMMRKELLEKIGGFDESLPVCEDYDLWLRIAARHSVPLLPDRLVLKRGGHPDQLSRSTWGLDRYRISALQKLLRAGLDEPKKSWALEVMTQKVAILSEGARKRGRESDALKYRSNLSEWIQEKENVGGANLPLRRRERVSPADGGSLVELG